MTKHKQYIGYRITNKTNGRYYIGIVDAYIWDRPISERINPFHGKIPATPHYMGSGKDIRRAVIKHGWQAFEREVLARFSNTTDAEAWEVANAVMNDDDPMSYNLQSGGKRGFKVAKTTRAKLAAAFKGKPKSAEHIANMRKGQIRRRDPDYEASIERYPCGTIKKKKITT